MKGAIQNGFILLVMISLMACGSSNDSEGGSATVSSPPPVSPESTPIEPPVPQKFQVTVSWDIPNERENGNALLLSEIGGYHLLYRSDPNSDYSIMLIEDQTLSEVTLDELDPGDYEFSIAVFDNNGLYSAFTEPMLASLN